MLHGDTGDVIKINTVKGWDAKGVTADNNCNFTCVIVFLRR